MCVGANIGRRYPCLCPVFMRGAKVKIRKVHICRPRQAGTGEGSRSGRESFIGHWDTD